MQIPAEIQKVKVPRGPSFIDHHQRFEVYILFKFSLMCIVTRIGGARMFTKWHIAMYAISCFMYLNCILQIFSHINTKNLNQFFLTAAWNLLYARTLFNQSSVGGYLKFFQLEAVLYQIPQLCLYFYILCMTYIYIFSHINVCFYL